MRIKILKEKVEDIPGRKLRRHRLNWAPHVFARFSSCQSSRGSCSWKRTLFFFVDGSLTPSRLPRFSSSSAESNR